MNMKSLTRLTIIILSTIAFTALADKPKPDPSVMELKQRALALEKAGDRLQAAGIYEQLAAKDASSRTVLANRLAKLYAQEGCSDKALHWASVAAITNPDPQAYMAGIHSMLGDDQNAIRILTKELTGKNDPSRILSLSSQLAAVYERTGDLKKAEHVLQTAVSELHKTSFEDAAEKQLNAFKKKRNTNQKQNRSIENP